MVRDPKTLGECESALCVLALEHQCATTPRRRRIAWQRIAQIKAIQRRLLQTPELPLTE